MKIYIQNEPLNVLKVFYTSYKYLMLLIIFDNNETKVSFCNRTDES